MPSDLTIYASVRAKKITDQRHLGRIQSHGRRLDPTAQRRVVPERAGRTVAASAYCPDEPLRVVLAHTKAKQVLGAVEYGRAAIGLHLIIILSAALIAEGGDPHDPHNLMNQELVSEGTAWAEGVFGKGSVIASRLDLDEAGCGELDVIVVPVRTTRMNAVTSKVIISVNGALEAIRSQHDDETSFGALQTSWALHAKAQIDPRIERGVHQAETQRRHVGPDVYRKVAQAARAAAEKDIQDALTDAHVAGVAAQEERNALEIARAGVVLAEQKLQEQLERAAKATIQASENAAQLERSVAATDAAARELQAKASELAQREILAQQEHSRLSERQANLRERRQELVVAAQKLEAQQAAIKSQAQAAAGASISAIQIALDAFLDGRIEHLEDPGEMPGPFRVTFGTQISTDERAALLGALRRGSSAGLAPLLVRVQTLVSEAEIAISERRALEQRLDTSR